jgi:exodeoxyribonuclease VII large subunit
MQGERTIFTPSELNHEAKLHLEAGFGKIWLEGEISNLSRPASGHLYFSLKDSKAQIRCAFFRSGVSRISFQPGNGMQVQARGRLSLYEARGDYQLIVETMEQAGEGQLRAAFEALKRKLQAEGLFDQGLKRPMPEYPSRIAVITSPSGAVIRDILNVLKRRWPLAAVRLYPVAVQGNAAALEICKAVQAANKHDWGEAIVLGRGGGSLEDLQAFNDEAVAREIAGSAIPVVSAVGHETDFSIADFVADLRAPTPSAAAELLAPDAQALIRTFDNHLQQLERRMLGRLQSFSQSNDHLAQRLSKQHPDRKMAEHNKLLSSLSVRLGVSARKLIPDRISKLNQLETRIQSAGGRIVPERQQKLSELARTLNAVSPLPTLDRGYAILARNDGESLITSIRDVKQGQTLSAQLSDGRIYAEVERVNDELLAPDGQTDDKG